MKRQSQRITHIITGLSRGGAENVLYRLIAAQPDPACHSVISLLDEGIFGDRLRTLDVEVHCLDLRRSGIPSPMAILRLRSLLRQLQPEVVQTWMYHADLLGGLAARLAGRPVCWGIHHSNLSPDQNKRLTLRVARLCARLSAFIPARIVSCSERAIGIHRTLGYADRFDLIPNGLDVSRFVPLSAAQQTNIRGRLDIPEGGKVIGHLGRPDPQKDHLTLLAAFVKVAKERPDAWLLLAGLGLHEGDPYFDQLLASSGAAQFSGRIRALGQRDDVADLMNAMDVFVLSSAGEAFPNVLTEAMACGTPCVVTDVGDSAQIVGNTGWIRAPRDADGLALDVLAALAEADTQKEARSKLARRRIVDNFSIERMVAAYQATWDRALKG